VNLVPGEIGIYLNYERISPEEALQKRIIVCPVMMKSGNSRNQYDSRLLSFYLTTPESPAWTLKRFALINSRVSPGMQTGNSWTQTIRTILDTHDTKKEVLVSGIGMIHYDYPLYYWLKSGGRCAIVTGGLPKSFSLGGIQPYKWFLNHHNTMLFFLGDPEKVQRSTPEFRQFRDRMVIAACDFIVQGIVRPRGNMSQCIRRYKEWGGTVETPPTFSGKHADRKDQPVSWNQQLKQWRIRLESVGNQPKGSNEHRTVWHFTRGRKYPWPGQGWESYLDGLNGIGDPVPYTGLDTLIRILKMKRIQSSRYLIRGKRQVVCLTDASLNEIVPLCTWTRHVHRYRFEPFAIGFTSKTARILGARPAIYGTSDLYDRLPESERYRFQRFVSDGHDWRQEREWRLEGDLDFGHIDPGDITILVVEKAQKHVVEQYIDSPIHFLLDS
jgi:hypothetical protein